MRTRLVASAVSSCSGWLTCWPCSLIDRPLTNGDIGHHEIAGAILVVWTTITIVVLKVFDIVFVMTNGQWGTQVLANLMYDWMFRGTPDYGRGSAIAIVLMILVTPIMVWNIYNARKEVR